MVEPQITRTMPRWSIRDVSSHASGLWSVKMWKLVVLNLLANSSGGLLCRDKKAYGNGYEEDSKHKHIGRLAIAHFIGKPQQ